MRCTDPRTVGFKPDGKTIAWSQKDCSKQYAPFQLPCGQCLECRLEYGRMWSIRCVHESKMYPQNSFITLTYADEHLGHPKLDYKEFQTFIKKLRDEEFYKFKKAYGKIAWALLTKQERKEKLNEIAIGYFVTGEYGEKGTKRKHWHAIVFNWRPSDCKQYSTSDRGDKVYTSETLTRLWGKGRCELGSVTFESAGYCARYAAKKLGHGHDASHDYNPISKKSSKHAIGKKWLEKFHDDIFNYGKLVVNGRPVGDIPRYYVKWLQKHQPQKWERYVTETRQQKQEAAAKQAIVDQGTRPYSNSKYQAQRVITEEKIKNRLHKYLKL